VRDSHRYRVTPNQANTVGHGDGLDHWAANPHGPLSPGVQVTRAKEIHDLQAEALRKASQDMLLRPDPDDLVLLQVVAGPGDIR